MIMLFKTRISFFAVMIFFMLLFLPVFSGQSLYAQGTGSGIPVHISAEESLEWHRNDQFFRARKNVEVQRGDTSLYSTSLIARYADSANKSVDVYQVEATGAVRIVSKDGTAYGDRAVYEVKKSYAVLTGDHLRVVSDGQRLSAHDKIEYWIDDGRLVASGDVEAQREGDVITADEMIALFEEDAQGERVLKSLEARGNVIITTPNERLTGESAFYVAVTSVAEIKGNVKITRGPNILEGAHAEVNLDTNVSKIFGGQEKDGGRVSGTFFPGSDGQ